MNPACPAWLSAPPQPLHDQPAVEQALTGLAHDIHAALAGHDPLLLCMVNGGIVVTGMLLPRLALPLQLDYVHLYRYRGARQGGALHWVRRPPETVRDRTVLLVDDVLDVGLTMQEAIRACHAQGAARVLCAVLVDKQLPQRSVQADFTGLRAPDRYLVGCGMDYRGYMRNLPGICILPE